jgi:hypothetical protein
MARSRACCLLPLGRGPCRPDDDGHRHRRATLGLENLPDGASVCDAHRGLLALDPATGELETLLTEVDGDRLLFTNNAAVMPDGTIWFSDSSRIWPIEEWKNDLIEHTCTGRLLRRSPDGEVTTVLDRLCFANGVALTAEMDAVLVAETGTRTIRRVALGADGSPRSDTICTARVRSSERTAREALDRAADGARPGLRRHALAPRDGSSRARRPGVARQPRRTGDRVVRRARGPLVTSRRAPRG